MWAEKRTAALLAVTLRSPSAGKLCPVSYTHLRAHETVLDIVCRLLLEKKNNPYTYDLYPTLSISSTLTTLKIDTFCRCMC